MNEMIERVARHFDPKAWNLEPKTPLDEKAIEHWKHVARLKARAAIEAMRTPTDEILEAGATNLYGVSREKAVEYAKEDKYESDGRKAAEIWQAMIDAALE